MQFHLKEDGTGVVVAEGELTLYAAVELRETMLEALERAERVELDFEKVNNMDLPCLQLLCSAMETSRELKKTMTFGDGLPEVVQKTAKDAGYPDMAQGCGPRRREAK